jgi:hypothetical protein
MNERIRELIKQMDQAGLPYGDNAMTVTDRDLEYFAELIVNRSKETMLTAEVAVLTEMVRVLSDKVNELEAKQEQGEPVAWGMKNDGGQIYDCITPMEHLRIEGEYTVPLYTTPQQRTWVGLNDTDLAICLDEGEVREARYWERVCKEKNT